MKKVSKLNYCLVTTLKLNNIKFIGIIINNQQYFCK